MPISIARELSIEPGDRFYWRVSDDHPGTIELIPAEVVERRYAKGEALERLAAETAAELPVGTSLPSAESVVDRGAEPR